MRIPGGVGDTEDDNRDREEPDRQQPEGRDVESLDLDDVGNEVERLSATADENRHHCQPEDDLGGLPLSPMHT